MSSIRVGINGFGRIGRITFRAILKKDDIESYITSSKSRACRLLSMDIPSQCGNGAMSCQCMWQMPVVLLPLSIYISLPTL